MFEIETKISATDAAAFDGFGSSVAISGNLALVGVPSDDDRGFASGAAYLYENIPEPSTLLLGVMACLGGFLRRNR